MISSQDAKGFLRVLGKVFFVFLSQYLRSSQSLRGAKRCGNQGLMLKALTYVPGLLPGYGFAVASRFARNDSIIKIFFLIMIFTHSTLAAVPQPWQMNFQPAASPMMEGVAHMHNFLLVVIGCIALLVSGLLSYVMVRFRASRNPIPSKTAHHTLLEVVWTLIPVLVLVMIAIPSLKLLFAMDKAQNASMTVKAIGHQWYWTYEYPEKQISYDSLMIEDKDIQPGQIRLLSVDNPIVVPVETTVRILVTSQDVLHSFAVPSLGIKKDAVPGRLNETWLRIGKEGDYYGQCSELCGIKHGFMPIHVKAVSQEEYDAWIESKSPQSKETGTKAEKPALANHPISQNKDQKK
jgi:cytochrome c oxidase subunit 2